MPSLTKALSSWPPYVGGLLGATVLWIGLIVWHIPSTITQAYAGHIRTIQSQTGDVQYLQGENRKLVID